MFKQLYPAVLITIIISCTSQAVDIGLKEANFQIGAVLPKNQYESIVGIAGGINPVNFDEFLGLHFDMQYRFAFKSSYSYQDVVIKGHIRQKFPLGNSTPYIGIGFGHRMYKYNWKIR